MITDEKVKMVHYLIVSEGPIISSHIESKFGIEGTEVRMIVRQLRRDGFIIVGSKKGYYETHNPEEVVRIVKDLQSRIKSQQATLALFRENAHKRFGYRIEEAIKSHSGEIQAIAEKPTVSHTRYGKKESRSGGEERDRMQVVPINNREEESGRSEDIGGCAAFSLDELLRSTEGGTR